MKTIAATQGFQLLVSADASLRANCHGLKSLGMSWSSWSATARFISFLNLKWCFIQYFCFVSSGMLFLYFICLYCFLFWFCLNVFMWYLHVHVHVPVHCRYFVHLESFKCKLKFSPLIKYLLYMYMYKLKYIVRAHVLVV